jgi:hypothetical protein
MEAAEIICLQNMKLRLLMWNDLNNVTIITIYMYRKTKLFGENSQRNYKIDATIYTEVWKMVGKLDNGLNFLLLSQQ